MDYIVFGDDDRMNYTRTLLAAESCALPACVFAPNKILSADEVKKLPWSCVIFAGGLSDEAEELARTRAMTVRRYGDSAEFTFENAEITAETVISLILNKTDAMLREQKILVVGFGKCGRAICRSLFGLAADFAVMTSRPENTVIYAAAVPYGDSLAGYDIIVNTAPQQVITEKQLDEVKKSAVIIDIASKPYGLNHAYAVSIGLDCAVYPALPARFRPRSAARAMVKFILEGEND